MIDAVAAGSIAGELALVLTNRPGSGAQRRAEAHGVPLAVVDHKAFDGREAFEAAMIEAIDAHGVELVVLAGFMRILTPLFVRRYAGRMVNIHPSMLPHFKGKDAIGAALAAGVDATGVTVHYVNEDVDSGAIIAQEAVAIRPDDTRASLQARVQVVEHRLYPRVVDQLLRELA